MGRNMFGGKACESARAAMTSDPTPYGELNSVLHELLSNIRVALGESLAGVYLQGSFALGDFDGDSDVDFIVVTRDELTEPQVAALQTVHARVYALESEWAKHLEGSYFPVATLRDVRECGTPLWYLDHGSRSLVRSDHCNTIVVRWVVREHGIALSGPHPLTLIDPIPVDVLRREMVDTIQGWGQQILDQPDEYRNRFYQGFIVLSYCRMLHDVVEGRPGSKRAGAAWAKRTFGDEWSPLIDRAWGGRPNPAASVREPADVADFDSTLRFVRLIMQESERLSLSSRASARDLP